MPQDDSMMEKAVQDSMRLGLSKEEALQGIEELKQFMRDMRVFCDCFEAYMQLNADKQQRVQEIVKSLDLAHAKEHKEKGTNVFPQIRELYDILVVGMQ